ncbi:cellulose biosynthesis protein BcsQ [Pseudacidovorax intermedius]|uniref:cellulose biosynthesis protein BcsQ n=1 Tax=Pseudacidovorax intermedius TaxID=433924 RepID=UPI0026EE518E|nr:cellulose biosynthesis protein BcsQ [Pseudacidovorax intermedius]
MATVLALVASKGGVGKTTLAANLAAALARQGRPVLALDLDPQNALRLHLAPQPLPTNGLADVVLGRIGWRQSMMRGRGGVVLLPFGQLDDEQLVAFQQSLAAQPDWLAQAIEGWTLPADAVVVVDTPPGPSVFLQQVLRVASLALMPLLADAASFATRELVERMVDKYALARAGFGGLLYLVNQVAPERRLARDVLQRLRDELGPRLIGELHQDQAVSEAMAHMLPVAQYAPHSQAAHDIDEAVRRLLPHLDATSPGHWPAQA